MLKSKKLWMVVAALVLIIVGCSTGNDNASNQNAENNDDSSHTPPSMDDLDPDDPETEYVEYGEELFNETNVELEESGNELSCQSCHADGGYADSSSMVGVAADFPQYRPREGVSFTLEDRINGCMVRSMNGEKLDYDSEEMRALMSYMTYLSEGVEIGQDRPWVEENTMEEVPEPDVDHGEELYADKSCLSCHGEEGEGTGANEGPALWGDDSFNDGAGMGRLTKAAGYIQNNMPVGEENTLSDQEAADLAAFLLSQDRPEWDGHDDDFPGIDAPTDIITQDKRDQIQDDDFDWTEIDDVVPKD